MTPIREYRTSPEHARNATTQKWEWVWLSRISIDLRFVAAAEPWEEFTTVAMAGGRIAFVVEVAYPTFVNDWMTVMKAEP